jgi:hypothetical protein
VRARNLKPSFFRNAKLLKMPPATRLLFIGLWCMADREGRLEDRPDQIAVEILPFDDCNLDAELDILASVGLIERYQVDGQPLIWIPKFLDHQRPHHREKHSTLPAFPEQDTEKPHPGTALPDLGTSQPALNPESGILNPESPPPTTLPAQKQKKRRHRPLTQEQRAKLVADFKESLGGEAEVNESIEAALDHVASTKYTDMNRYCRNWLRRQVSPPSLNGKARPKGDTSHFHVVGGSN